MRIATDVVRDAEALGITLPNANCALDTGTARGNLPAPVGIPITPTALAIGGDSGDGDGRSV